MPHEPPDQAEIRAISNLVETFIEARLTPKLEDLDKKLDKESEPDKKQAIEEKREQLLFDYRKEQWLENAAKRVMQVQLVTHALKYTHPEARGSSLYVGDQPPVVNKEFLGTHSLGMVRPEDVVGNAAALDVYKFLKLEHRGKPLLGRVCARDPELIAALSENSEKASAWVERFASITGSDKPVASHKLAKQLYFPLSDGGYHLLAPLFPTSLIHTVHTQLREARFSEKTKEARQARRDGKDCPHGYHEYPNLAIQVFGGTKPQNVSQLNSERYGENWLLPSFPPTWHSKTVQPPLSVKTVFGRWFGSRPVVRELTKVLAKFLAGTQYNNVHIRRTRAELVAHLSDELLNFAAELAELPPGWSAAPDCKLNEAEALWLDPTRALNDETFASRYHAGNWKEEVAHRFGNWLNHQLNYHDSLPMGEAEHTEWKGMLSQTLNMIKTELAHD